MDARIIDVYYVLLSKQYLDPNVQGMQLNSPEKMPSVDSLNSASNIVPEPLVTLRDVSVTLGASTRALDRIDFVLEKGGHTAIHGRNGSGKSTLLRVVRGELPPDRGAGQVIWHTPDGPETFGVLGQRMTALVSTAQLEHYVSKGWRINGETIILTGFPDTPLLYASPSRAECAAVQELARELEIEPLLNKELPQLSHGQVRILLLARACIRKPEILLLDEFTDGLDTWVRERVNAILERMADHSTILAVAHRIDALPGCMKRLVLMHEGRIVEQKIFEKPTPGPDAPGLLVSPLKPGNDSREVLAASSPALPEQGEVLVKIVNADVFVGGVHVLRDINWEVRSGEQWAVIGHNGAGKSTLLRLVSGVENVAFGGSIARYLPGQGEGVIVELEKLRRGIGIVSDRIQATYWYDLCGEDLVCSGFERSVGLFRPPDARETSEASLWMARLGITGLAKRRIRTLSTGQLRRFMLARALVGTPDIVLLDEPCSGLDPQSREELLTILDALAGEGVHFILVTHHESDIFSAITHVACLQDGAMIRQGPVNRIDHGIS